MLNQDLLKILACPKCLGELLMTEPQDGLICQACRLVYPIREEIPIMLPAQAVRLEHWVENTGSSDKDD